MAVESQARGETCSDTVGNDYEEFCKENVENAQRQNFSIKIFNMIISSGICLGLVLPIMYLLALLFGITNIQSTSVYLIAPLAFILKYMLIVFILHTGWFVVKRNIYRSSTVNIGAYIILFIFALILSDYISFLKPVREMVVEVNILIWMVVFFLIIISF